MSTTTCGMCSSHVHRLAGCKRITNEMCELSHPLTLVNRFPGTQRTLTRLASLACASQDDLVHIRMLT